MTPAESVLPRLECVREFGNGRGIARCPAHDDKNPSLAFRICDDGTLLLKCWAGCSPHGIVDALGLKVRDLFVNQRVDRRRLNERIDYRQALALIMRESMLVLLAANDTQRGIALSDGDMVRLGDAVGRIRELCTAAGVNHG